MFIDFEGIDGSGKTTLSNRLAARLTKLGYRVAHAREGGELQSPTARRIRDLTRDSKLLEMSSQAEFFLNLARDAQQLDEVIKPALSRGEVCISDRYLYSQLALSSGGRGLPLEALEPAVQLASQGVWPDLVILVDVDPDLARLRKRVGKLGTVKADSSRKGLAGAGLAVRVRNFFLELARNDPARWIVIENNHEPLWALEQRIVDLVMARLEGRELQVRRIAGESSLRDGTTTIDTLAQRFHAMLDDLETREPGLALYLIAGLPGPDMHARRLRLAERHPALVARSLAGLGDDDSYALRNFLKAQAPAEVIDSLGSSPDPRAMQLRFELYDRAPAAVLSGLKGNASVEAWQLRTRAEGDRELLPALLCGLARVDDPFSWETRSAGLRANLYADVARSLSGLTDERADQLRRVLLKHDRLAVLKSLAGLDTPFARSVREQLFEKAPKAVLRSLTGVDADYAYEMRERAAPRTKEALDSIDGMNTEQAWSIRERYCGTWASTSVSSLKWLAHSERGRALIEKVLAENPGRISVLRNAYEVLVKPVPVELTATTERIDVSSGPEVAAAV